MIIWLTSSLVDYFFSGDIILKSSIFTNTPLWGKVWKYRLPSTEPSLFPTTKRKMSIKETGMHIQAITYIVILVQHLPKYLSQTPHHQYT